MTVDGAAVEHTGGRDRNEADPAALEVKRTLSAREQVCAMRVCRALQISLFIAVVAAAWVGEPVPGSFAQTQPSISRNASPNTTSRKQNAPRKESGIAENPYTVGFVTGAPQSTEFAMAQDIATTLASGQETGPHGEVALRVMPMVGNGGIRNLIDVLTLADADIAIAPVVLADRLRETRALGDIRDKLVYIAPLCLEEFQLLARPEIRSLADLAGKSVNLGEEGSAGAVLGREVLGRFNVKIAESNLGLDVALDAMRKSQIFATLVVSGKPVSDLAHGGEAEGIHFLPIPYSPEMSPDYLPSTLRHEDYPKIIGTNESVDTIAIRSAVFAYNWPTRSARYQLLDLFVQTLFSRFPQFLGDGHHPKWQEANLAAPLPGWQRFRPAEHWLQQASLRDAFDRFIEQNSVDTSDRNELFQEFLRWRQRNPGR